MTYVVVSVGTDHHSFTRLLEWISIAKPRLQCEFFVQRGATPERHDLASVDYVTADELAELMRSADAVVCHGGPGTIALARRSGHRPIVVARNPDLDEHVDDHQLRYTARCAANGEIDSARSVDELIELLSSPRPRHEATGDLDVSGEGVATFAGLVDALLSGQLPTRRWRDRFLLKRVL